MRALVTGAAGFLGSTLAEELRRQGFEVRGADAFTVNYDPGRKRANLVGLLRDPGFQLVEEALRQAEERLQGERGVPQPAVAVVPVPLAADPFRKGSGRRCDDGARSSRLRQCSMR